MYDAESLPTAFAGLQPQAADSLLSLIALFRDDPRPMKIDLGVGVYRDAWGATPVFVSVKVAEELLLREQNTKAYLGPEGDVGFLERLIPIVFGGSSRPSELVSVQTPGGTRALRLAADLIAAGRPGSSVWIRVPSGPIHAGIFRQAGLKVEHVPYFDQASQRLAFERFVADLEAAEAGDVVLLHGACHNPSGADLSLDQWAKVADLLQRRAAIPLVDLAYQGLGLGLDEDAAGLRQLMASCDTVIVAQSCDKNFGLYRERTGALFVRAPRRVRELVRSNVLQLARVLWAMPPDHGAAVVRAILESEDLVGTWQAELTRMRDRLDAVRTDLAAALPRVDSLRDRRGLFALLPLTAAAIESLRRDHAVYMAGSGRINLAGLSTVEMRAQGLSAHRLSRGDARHMYWTVAQMIAHHTSNGCNLRPGDLLGTGTLSAPTEDGYGSLLEISRGGVAPIALPSGETRAFLEDGHEIALTGRLSADGYVGIGFGPCSGMVRRALAG
ncbi:MAG: aromatic amino acid transaminase [Caulobacteraceae bacterium]